MNTSKIQNLLKFLVSHYQFPLVNDDSGGHKLSSPFYSSPYIIKLFTVLLDNFINDGMPMSDFNDTGIDDSIKIRMIKDIDSNVWDNTAIQIFNLIDIMYKTIKITLGKLNKGILNFNNTCKVKDSNDNLQDFKLDVTLNNNAELLVYTLFYTTFSPKLKLELKKVLNISNLEESILNRCNNKIFENISINQIDANADINICKPIAISMDPEELVKKSCNTYMYNVTNMFAKKSIYTNIETPLAMLAFLQIFIQLRTSKAGSLKSSPTISKSKLPVLPDINFSPNVEKLF